jgi:hypothetical protein
VNAGDPNDVPLSDRGATRRDAILADALRAADRRRRARVARHVAGVACVCLLAVGTFTAVNRLIRTPVQPTPFVHRTPSPTSSAAPPAPATHPETPPRRVIVQIIPADRVERSWQVIDDEQLISAMAAAGKPGGVARLNGRAVVVPLQ